MPKDIDLITAQFENINLDEDSDIDSLCQNLSNMKLNVTDTKDIEDLCTSINNLCIEKKVKVDKLQKILSTIYWTGMQALDVGPWKDFYPRYVDAF